MTFVSYAQNFEDVMLHRALRHVTNGFYVDVGVQDPVELSVTKAFYDAGWRGINVEPIATWVEKLRQERPRDITVHAAAGDTNGTMRMYEVQDTGLSTSDFDIAKRHSIEGDYQYSEVEVSVRTLASILAEYAQSEIHFLKIDVEGMEERVIRGNDWERYRPWVLVVEAMEPMRQVSNHQAWEPILDQARYHFVYSDGVNRFYVSEEHLELKSAFVYPPNYFDDFQLASSISIDDRLAHSEAARADLANRLHAMECSISWRITAPLRAANSVVRAMVRIAIRSPRWVLSRPKAVAKVGVRRAVRFMQAHPKLKDALREALIRFPRLYSVVRRLAARATAGQALPPGPLGALPGGLAAHRIPSGPVARLSPRAQAVWRDLMASRKRSRAGQASRSSTG